MSPIEELFQLVARKNMSLLSRPAPHGKWRMSITWPEKANMTNAKSGNSVMDMDVCNIDACSPEQAAIQTLETVKKRLEDFERRGIYQ